MTDDDFERRLVVHYRTIDPKVAPARLSARIGDSFEERRTPIGSGRASRPVQAAVAAVIVIVAAGLALRLGPGGFLTSPGTSPSPIGSVAPTIAPSSLLATASPTAPSPTPGSVELDSGSPPPISTAPWTAMRLAPTEGGLAKAESVVAWSGGYIALGNSGEGLRLPAWVSRDGRRWVQLPVGTFGEPVLAIAVPCADGVLVITESATGETTIWQSVDGTTWTSKASERRLAVIAGTAAGNADGTVALVGTPLPDQVVFSADGVAWQSVPLADGSGASVYGVAAFGTGFVAVGAGTTGSPAAWWSDDGLTWRKAVVGSKVQGSFDSVRAGRDGLVAESRTGLVPGLTTFWTSRDGRTWAVSKADPLGTFSGGEGEGSANGLFQGDGTRLLGYGIRANSALAVVEYWVSLDATRWTKLVLSGDAAGAADATPFLMRDGVLFVTDSGSWFGSPVP